MIGSERLGRRFEYISIVTVCRLVGVSSFLAIEPVPFDFPITNNIKQAWIESKSNGIKNNFVRSTRGPMKSQVRRMKVKRCTFLRSYDRVNDRNEMEKDETSRVITREL